MDYSVNNQNGKYIQLGLNISKMIWLIYQDLDIIELGIVLKKKLLEDILEYIFGFNFRNIKVCFLSEQYFY